MAEQCDKMKQKEIHHQQEPDMFVFNVDGQEVPADIHDNQSNDQQDDDIRFIAEFKSDAKLRGPTNHQNVDNLAPIFRTIKRTPMKKKLRPSWTPKQWSMAKNQRKAAREADAKDKKSELDNSKALIPWAPSILDSLKALFSGTPVKENTVHEKKMDALKSDSMDA